MSVKILTQNTWALAHIITTPVTASIRATRVCLSVGTDDGERLGFFEGKSMCILQKDDALLADFAHETAVG
jgi:hypothetical protein